MMNGFNKIRKDADLMLTTKIDTQKIFLHNHRWEITPSSPLHDNELPPKMLSLKSALLIPQFLYSKSNQQEVLGP